MQNTLGISIGTRLLGMAVMYDGELQDFRVRTFYGAWNGNKKDDIVEVIQKTIERYGIMAITIKCPKASHRSQSIHALISALRLISSQKGIKLAEYTITGLIGQYNGQIKGNKQVLIQSIIEKYPNHKRLAEIYAKERNNRSAYHVKLFEAIACAEISKRTGL